MDFTKRQLAEVGRCSTQTVERYVSPDYYLGPKAMYTQKTKERFLEMRVRLTPPVVPPAARKEHAA